MPKNTLKSKKFKDILNNITKRVLDISVSTVLLVAVSPILIYTSYRIKKEDNGPILFKQKRSGLYNETFNMYKFRSMKVHNKVIGTHTFKNENIFFDWDEKVPDDFVFKSAKGNNPNITNIGGFIRKYSIDELPQLINVLKGEMSVVGPRPEIIEISQYYDSQQLQRLEVKPGITGWAQVNGRSDIQHGVKIQYDIYYVENQSILLDFKILLMTIVKVIKGSGSV